MTNERCGYVAIVGRPNVGKSTLLNAILKKKISITSPKPQTTRHQILGVKTLNDVQALYMDTPGLHEETTHAMNRYLNRLATAMMPDADVIVFVIEAMVFKKDDELVLKTLQSLNIKAPVILVINKVDQLGDKQVLLPFMAKMMEKYPFAVMVPLSATNKENVDALQIEIMQRLPVGPHLFPDNQFTDKPERFQVAEFIREQVINATEQEIPYSTTVAIESLDKKGKITEISAVIWVEREGQKAIVIGVKGERLKKIGTLARKEIERYLGCKVFLRLWVKVKEKWTDDERALKSLGYD